MTSARSWGFLKPGKFILVLGIIFLGLRRYSKRVSSDQVMPEFLLASEYLYSSTEPEVRPKRP